MGRVAMFGIEYRWRSDVRGHELDIACRLAYVCGKSYLRIGELNTTIYPQPPPSLRSRPITLIRYTTNTEDVQISSQIPNFRGFLCKVHKLVIFDWLCACVVQKTTHIIIESIEAESPRNCIHIVITMESKMWLPENIFNVSLYTFYYVDWISQINE